MFGNINQLLSSAASYFGLQAEGERSKPPHLELSQQINKATGGAAMLSDCLFYDYFDQETGLFCNNDGSCGFWYELQPLVGSDEGLEKNLTLFFNDELPHDVHLQFLIIAGHDISDVIARWEKPRVHGGEGIEYITKYRKYFIENCARDFKSSADGRLARNFRTFISCCKFTGDKAEFTRFRLKLETKLKAEQLSPELLRADDLVWVGRDLLQMDINGKSAKVKYSQHNNLSVQLCPPLQETIINQESISHLSQNLESRIFYPKELPESFSLAEMVSLLGSGDKTVPARFVISYSVASNLGNRGTSRLVAQGYRSLHAAERDYTRHDLTAKAEAREWLEVLDIHKKGEKFLSESMMVMITALSSDIEIAQESLKSLWNRYDFKLAINKNLQLLSLIAILPMMQASIWKSLSFFKLTRNVLSGEVVAKLPLQGEWRGVPASGVLLMGRRGQLFNFNPFYRVGGGGNYNIAMMAPSGSGKSFLLQELATSMIGQNVSVFVMDIGASYKNICQRLSGEMIGFNQDNKLSLNPFSGLSNSGALYVKALELINAGQDHSKIAEITGLTFEQINALAIGRSGAGFEVKEQEAIEILEIKASNNSGQKSYFVTKDSIIYAKAMLSSMCGVSGDIRGEAIIERAISKAISIYGTALDITKLAATLEKLTDHQGKLIEDAAKFADSLYPFTSDGIHGRYFKSGNEASFKAPLTVFEFEEIKDDRPLLAVVLQVILMQITMQFLCGDRSKYFMLVVDEAWMIMDFAASFLERFARTVRKYGGSLIVCTQDITSFTKSPSHRAIIESSTWKLILQQKDDGIAAFAKEESYLPYLGLIRSIKKCSSNKFSEVLIDTNGVKVVGRLVTDPYSTALYSTEKEDYNYLLGLEKQGVSKHAAILALAKKYGKLPEEER